jgi:hypothetical protein
VAERDSGRRQVVEPVKAHCDRGPLAFAPVGALHSEIRRPDDPTTPSMVVLNNMEMDKEWERGEEEVVLTGDEHRRRRSLQGGGRLAARAHPAVTRGGVGSGMDSRSVGSGNQTQQVRIRSRRYWKRADPTKRRTTGPNHGVNGSRVKNTQPNNFLG